MTTEYNAIHLSVTLQSNFEDFTRALEGALGRLDLEVLKKAGQDAEATAAAIKTMQGEEDMTLFNVEDLGYLLSLNGPPRKAKRYFIGNYMRAFQVVSAEIRLGLYAPLRVLVYAAADGTVHVEYDLPSSQFAQFDNELIQQSGLGLDTRLKNLITLADQRGTAVKKRS